MPEYRFILVYRFIQVYTDVYFAVYFTILSLYGKMLVRENPCSDMFNAVTIKPNLNLLPINLRVPFNYLFKIIFWPSLTITPVKLNAPNSFLINKHCSVTLKKCFQESHPKVGLFKNFHKNHRKKFAPSYEFWKTLKDNFFTEHL